MMLVHDGFALRLEKCQRASRPFHLECERAIQVCYLTQATLLSVPFDITAEADNG